MNTGHTLGNINGFKHVKTSLNSLIIKEIQIKI